MYWKEIIYMSLFENEIKRECVGYLKSEKRQDEYQLEIQVKKIPVRIAGNYPVRLQSETGWQETGTLVIKDGYGKWNGSIKEAVLKVEIIMSDSERIKGESKKVQVVEKRAVSQTEETGRNVETADVEKSSEPSDSIIEEAVLADEAQKVQVIQEAPKAIIDPEKESGTVLKAESMAAPVKTSPIKMPWVKTAPERKPLYENKWEQLLSTYEQIHPYGDNRVYVKLEPKDFIVLRENYQHLVNNSFLLHGFYNYRYLILGKEGEFYLGVPGVFYEREKMVALMFGFEAFECEGGEAEEGKFGYYLRKVEL